MTNASEKHLTYARAPSVPLKDSVATWPIRPRPQYAIEQRLRLIDFLLHQYGTVNRSALIDYFGISMQQASLDFREYMKLAPANMDYDGQAKTYRRTRGFHRYYP